MFGDDPFFGGDGGRDGRGRERRGDRRGERNGGLGGGMLSVFDDDQFFGGGFGNMGGMMQRMEKMMQGGGFGGDGSGDGTFFSSSSVMTMSTGPDGKKQQYSSHSRSSNVGGKRISETKQAYSNNAGLDKVGWERTIGDKGTKVVKERQRGTREETTTRMYHGMDPANGADFEKAWSEHKGRRALSDFGGHMERQMQRLSSGMNDFGHGRQGSRRTPSLRDRHQEHHRHAQPLEEAFPPRGQVLDQDYYQQPSSRHSSRHSSRQSSRQSSSSHRRLGNGY